MAHIGAVLLCLTLGSFWIPGTHSVNSSHPPELKFEYHKHQQLKEYLTDISKSYPHLTSLRSIGISVRREELLVLEVSAAPSEKLGIPNVKLLGNIHGNEPGGREVILHFIQFLVTNYSTNSTLQWLLNNTRIHLFPSVNPDGFKKSKYSNCTENENGRQNIRDVDLNRNFPDYFRKNTIPRQPETDALMKWFNEIPFILSASLHGGALVANYPFENTPEDIGRTVTGAATEPSLSPDDDVFQHLATVYSSAHPTMHKGLPCPGKYKKFKKGITNGAAWYPITGGMQDYNYVWHGCLELTLEISCCKYPKKEDLPKLWQENKEALLEYVTQAHHGVQGLVLDYETNETISGAKLWIEGRNCSFNSSKNGEFWRILLPGNYTLQINAEGYRPSSAVPFFIDTGGNGDEPRMTWLNVSLISLNSTVSETSEPHTVEGSTFAPSHSTTWKPEVRSSENLTSNRMLQGDENVTMSSATPSTLHPKNNLSVNNTSKTEQTYFMQEVLPSAGASIYNIGVKGTVSRIQNILSLSVILLLHELCV